MLTFTANNEQTRELSALAYRIADIAYMKERHGENGAKHELATSRKTLENCIFPRLDGLNVPYWVQNSVIACAENWRNYVNGNLQKELAQKGVCY